jgi:hypothetical protein
MVSTPPWTLALCGLWVSLPCFQSPGSGLVTQCHEGEGRVWCGGVGRQKALHGLAQGPAESRLQTRSYVGNEYTLVYTVMAGAN